MGMPYFFRSRFSAAASSRFTVKILQKPLQTNMLPSRVVVLWKMDREINE